MTKTLDDIYVILSEILLITKESNNNMINTFEIDASKENDLPEKIDLNDYENVVIIKQDDALSNIENIISGKGKLKISWKQ